MEGLAGYVLRRLLFLPITLFIVSFATFYITRWGPGDPVRVYAQAGYSDPEALDRVRDKYGLDEPIIVQYGVWLQDVVTEGEYLSQGSAIRVIRSEGYRHVVQGIA